MKEITSAYISVIIPCHNGQLFISETINSVLSQTFQNFEIIIINDGSTDDKAKVINKFKDSRIVHLNKINSGVSDSRNKGLQVSKGDYVLFLDSDDILSFDFLEKRILFLSKHPNLGFCSSKVIKIDANGNKIHDKTWRGVASGGIYLDPSRSKDPNFLSVVKEFIAGLVGSDIAKKEKTVQGEITTEKSLKKLVGAVVSSSVE